MNPIVSVIIASYNSAAFLPETLNSVLSQDVAGIEVILVDDASTDDTPRVLEEYRDRIVVLRLPENTGGPAAPRNRGVLLARGRYISIFDSDDCMGPGKLREQIELLETHPAVPLVFTNFRNFSAEGPSTHDFLADHDRFHAMPRVALGERWYRLNAETSFETLMVDNFIGTSGVVLRRSLIDQVGQFDEGLRCGEDLDYWLRVCRSNDIAYIDREHHRRRLHPGNISQRTSSMEDVLKVAERLRGASLPPAARRNLTEWLADLHFDVGYRHKASGQRLSAIRHYAASLRYRMNTRATLAILKALIPIPHRTRHFPAI